MRRGPIPSAAALLIAVGSLWTLGASADVCEYPDLSGLPVRVELYACAGTPSEGSFVHAEAGQPDQEPAVRGGGGYYQGDDGAGGHYTSAGAGNDAPAPGGAFVYQDGTSTIAGTEITAPPVVAFAGVYQERSGGCVHGFYVAADTPAGFYGDSTAADCVLPVEQVPRLP